MKHIIRLLLFVISFTAFSGAASAQNRKQRLTREQLAEVQAKHIAKKANPGIAGFAFLLYENLFRFFKYPLTSFFGYLSNKYRTICVSTSYACHLHV